MSTGSISKPAPSSTLRVLPLLVCFDEEIEIRRSLVDIPRYRRISFESALKLPSDVERIIISGDESLLLRSYEEIRKPSCRLIALTDHRFHDPRLDALAYAYLPAKTPHELLERTIDNALDHIHLIHVREQINERLRGVTREIQELNKIGALRVISRTSVMKYQNAAMTIPQIARELGVDAVVEGAIDAEGRPTRVRPLEVVIPEQRQRWEEAEQRRARRLGSLVDSATRDMSATAARASRCRTGEGRGGRRVET